MDAGEGRKPRWSLKAKRKTTHLGHNHIAVDIFENAF